MEDWTRVVLYGTYDGFVRSTVDSLQITVRLDGGERVEIPRECVISAAQIVKKDEIKLRDVIKRIKDLDIGAREVWLNEILNELGSDYGTLKYKDGYEQGKLEGTLEREKVTVPQFVADWIEKCKSIKQFISSLAYALNSEVWSENSLSDDCIDWLYIAGNQDIFARAWLDGYTVEKEKRYFVRLKGVVDNLRLLRHNLLTNTWTIGSEEQCFNVSRAHTRKELEQAGFGWVFDCPGIEIEEVEE